MKTQKIIAVFNKEFQTIGFVSVGPEIVLEVTLNANLEQSTDLKKVVETLKTQSPRIRKEEFNKSGVMIDISEIKAENENYITAVAEELKLAGFSAKTIPEILKPILLQISTALSEEQRKSIIGEVINLPNDIEEEAIVEIQKIIESMEIFNKINRV